MAVSDTLINTLFDGRYRILRRLGSGGMANVYLAEDEELGRRVAIKILNDRYATDELFNERFRREAKSAAALSHPNIVSIYDRGEADGRPYIAMEVIEGRSLKELILTSGALPIPKAVEYAKQILNALRFAHRNGIIHRDIKPHNILLGPEERLKVTDFGIARSGASQMTEAGSIMGTAQYLSPEQARGAPVTAASDLYSVGVVLYEMLTGKTPFTGESPIEIAMKHLNEAPPPPSDLRPEIPPELDQIVLRALAKDPGERYQAAEELSADLDRVEAGIPVAPETTAAATAVLTGVSAAPTQVIPAETRTRVAGATAPPRRPRYPPDYGYRGPPPKQRRRFLPWLAALLLLAAAALAGWYVYSQVEENLQESRPVAVPPLVGLTKGNALRQLRALGLEGKVVEQASAERAAGRVFRQSPDEGTRLPKGERVTLYVSTGPPMTDVPGVVGLTYQDAVDELEKQNLGSRRIDVFADAPPGEVIAQKPRKGATVRRGSTVTLQVSKGQELVSVPDVLRQNEASARAELGENGFDVSVSSAPSDDVEEGLVFDQNPDPGTEANKGSTVEIVISEGPETATVPGVVEQDVESATSALENAGFDVRVRDEDTTDPAQENVVLDQNPAAGVKAEPGSTVTITIGKFVLPGADDQGDQGNGSGQGNGRGRAKGRSKDKGG
ncbi:MAG: Stk1 family PASTA domain-containing Ser/Thr kinase [Actinomycetota bacterium]|nr:Stk1 family PASTA domain-containing Ser/Thr kinase [Actinomycetota bacterium]